MRCSDTDRGRARIAPQPRIVQVIGGHFTIEDVPACSLWARATLARSRREGQTVDVEPGIRPRCSSSKSVAGRDVKTVHGTVRDDSGASPVADALVSGRVRGESQPRVTRTDSVGRFTVHDDLRRRDQPSTANGARRHGDGRAWRTSTSELVDVTLGTVNRPRGWDDSIEREGSSDMPSSS